MIVLEVDSPMFSHVITFHNLLSYYCSNPTGLLPYLVIFPKNIRIES